jgi:hypothetical protein
MFSGSRAHERKFSTVPRQPACATSCAKPCVCSENELPSVPWSSSTRGAAAGPAAWSRISSSPSGVVSASRANVIK